MGWDVPSMYIERTALPSEIRWELVAKPTNMIGLLAYPKAFLLGHGKYGPKPGWEPVEKLRGLPQDLSDDVSRLAETATREPTDPTWYSFDELQEIDLDEPMGLPDNEDPILRRPRDYLRFYTMVDNEIDEEISPSQLEPETIRNLIDNHGWVEEDGEILHSEPKKRSVYSRQFDELLAFMAELCGEGRYDGLGYAPEHVRLVIWAR